MWWWRLALLAVGSLLLGIGLAPQPPTPSPKPTPTPLYKKERPRWRQLWTRALSPLQRIELAPDGNVATLSQAGAVTLLREKDGSSAWSSPPLPLARGLVAVRGGLVLAYPLRNPALLKVWVLRGPLGQPSAFATDGPLWCVAASPDGEQAFFGTGTGQIQAVSLTAVRPPRAWQVGARPESIGVSTDGSDVVVGTWLLSGIRRLGGWAYTDPDPTRWHTVSLSADGATTVVLSGKGPRHAQRELRLGAYDSESGLRLWEKSLPGTHAEVALSADGQRIAVSYALETSHGQTRTREHRLQLLARNGAPLCEEKGGRFLDPRLLAISALGERITVLDGDRALLVLDSQGRTRWRLPFAQPTPIVESRSTPDGTYLLLRHADDTLTLYQATD